MENKSQIELLAKTALNTKNYNQAYNYYSQLLESDTNSVEYWKGKAFAAGYLSTLDQMKINEVITYIRTLMTLQNLSDSEKTEISTELVKIADIKILEGVKHVDSEIDKEFNALQIPTGTLYAVHQMRKTPIQLRVGSKYQEPLKEHFDLLVLACELNPTKENYEKIIKNFNLVFVFAKRHFDYFGQLNGDSTYSKEITNTWNNAVKKLKELNPNYSTQDSIPKGSSGCFIATATTGDYNHPTVMQLRLFRDNTLDNYNFGRKFIQFYYRNSPPIADYINQKTILKKLIYYFFIKPLSEFTKVFTNKDRQKL